ncbi:MAG: ABC transporter permease, partial [Caulobacterales bacterium]
AYRAADNWTAALSGSMTIRLMTPDDPIASAAALRTAESVLRSQTGVRKANGVGKARASELLAPWFGHGPLPDDLPLPSLVEVDVDPAAPPSPARLEHALRAAGLDPQIDDHRRWAGSVSDAAGALRIGALAVLALLAIAAAATVSFAARAGLEARRDIVEALHLVGAQDRYISRLFEHRFLGLGLRAGLLGAILATLGAGAIVVWLQKSGATTLLVGEIPLRPLDISVLAFTPLAAGLIGMWTARASVMGALKRLD